MNKTVYLFLKKQMNIQEKKKIKNILEKKLDLKEIEQLNRKYNDDTEKAYYNESDIKFLILNKNRKLFTNEENKYYTNLLGLKVFTKK